MKINELKDQPIGSYISADVIECNSQKMRAAALRESGYRKDHSCPGTWKRVSDKPYTSDYVKNNLSYPEKKAAVDKLPQDRTYTNKEVKLVCGVALRNDEIEMFMAGNGWTYKEGRWSK